MRILQVETTVMNEIEWAVDVFNKNGIEATVNNDNMIIISKYSQPKGTTFEKMGINEDELIKNVIACSGKFETRNSNLATFPLVVCQELIMDEKSKITQMPNLKAVGNFLPAGELKKLPKLKAAGSISMEKSKIKSLPKLKDVGILIAQNSELSDIPVLENAGKLCIVDCPVTELKSLETVGDLFICSTDENNKIDILTIKNLEEAEKIFIANSSLKSLPSLKKAKKIALYNCGIKSIKSSIKAEVEIQTKISDDELAEKFDTFTDWYNSDVFTKSLDILGDIVNQIQGK
jgi:hypothetical protein